MQKNKAPKRSILVIKASITLLYSALHNKIDTLVGHFFHYIINTFIWSRENCKTRNVLQLFFLIDQTYVGKSRRTRTSWQTRRLRPRSKCLQYNDGYFVALNSRAVYLSSYTSHFNNPIALILCPIFLHKRNDFSFIEYLPMSYCSHL